MDYIKPLQMKAYDILKDMILEGHFKKGEIYSETKASRELGISRTPIRDAIQRRLPQLIRIECVALKETQVRPLWLVFAKWDDCRLVAKENETQICRREAIKLVGPAKP